MPVPALLKWKQALDSWAASPEYQHALALYKKENTQDTLKISRCALVVWKKNYDDQMERARSKFVQDSIAKGIQRADSLEIVADIARNGSSPYDWMALPFGVMNRTVVYVLMRQNAHFITTSDTLLTVLNHDDSSAITHISYLFRLDGRMHGYVLRGAEGSADSLDRFIRVAALGIAHELEKKIQRAPKIQRVGFFDITDSTFVPLAQWSDSMHTAKVGVIIQKPYRYIPIAYVNNTLLTPKTILRTK